MTLPGRTTMPVSQPITPATATRPAVTESGPPSTTNARAPTRATAVPRRARSVWDNGTAAASSIGASATGVALAGSPASW